MDPRAPDPTALDPRALALRWVGLRHGESEANVAGLIASDPAAAAVAWGLTPRGRAQVRASVAAAAPALGLGPATVVLASDLLRARETAALACAALGCAPAAPSVALRERWFGRLDGGPSAAYEQVWARDRRRALSGDRGDARATVGDEAPGDDRGVEPAEAVRARVVALVRALEARVGAGGPDGLAPGTAVLLVSHGDPLQLLATAFLGLPAGLHRDVPPWATGEVRPLGSGPSVALP